MGHFCCKDSSINSRFRSRSPSKRDLNGFANRLSWQNLNRYEIWGQKTFHFYMKNFWKEKFVWIEMNYGQKITENLKNVFRDAFPFFQSDYVETSLFKFYKKNLKFPVVLRGFVKDFCTIFYDLKSQRFYWTFWQFLFHCNAKKTVHVYETLGIS